MKQRKINDFWLFFFCCWLFFFSVGCVSEHVKPTRTPRRLGDARLAHEKADILYKKGNALFEKKSYQKALQLYSLYIKKAGFSSTAEGVLFRMCLASFYTKNLFMFTKYQTQLKRWFPGSSYLAKLQDYQWQLCFFQKRYKKSAKLLEKLLLKFELSRDLKRINRYRFYLALCYEKLYMPDYTIKQLLLIVRSRKKGPFLAKALHRLARHFYRKNDRELALYYVNMLLRDFPLYIKKKQAALLKRTIRWRYIKKRDGLGDNSISTIAFDGDDVWIGTWLGGISRFTRSVKKTVFFSAKNSALASNLVRDIKVAGTRVWAATFAGLSFYNKQLSSWHTIYSVAGLAYQRIKSLLVVDNRLWVATIAHGISVCDLKTGKWNTFTRKDGLPDNNVVTLCATPGSIWAGTVMGGVARYDLKTGRWRVYRKGGKGKLPSNNVKSIAFDGTRLWFGTHGFGVVSCREDGSGWKVYNKRNSGLTSNYVYSLAVAPSGKIWMGTLEGGAVSYNSANNHWQALTIKDGMPSNDITTIAFEGKYIWFGTLNGGVAVLLTDGGKNG